jgi:thiamine monophosphate synthase
MHASVTPSQDRIVEPLKRDGSRLLVDDRLDLAGREQTIHVGHDLSHLGLRCCWSDWFRFKRFRIA